MKNIPFIISSIVAGAGIALYFIGLCIQQTLFNKQGNVRFNELGLDWFKLMLYLGWLALQLFVFFGKSLESIRLTLLAVTVVCVSYVPSQINLALFVVSENNGLPNQLATASGLSAAGLIIFSIPLFLNLYLVTMEEKSLEKLIQKFVNSKDTEVTPN